MKRYVCRLYTTNYKLYIKHYTQHTTHYIQHSTYYILHTTHRTLHTTHRTLHTTHYTLHTKAPTHNTQHTTHYTPNPLHTTHYTPHYTLHATHNTLHTTHYTPHELWNTKFVPIQLVFYRYYKECNGIIMRSQISKIMDCQNSQSGHCNLIKLIGLRRCVHDKLLSTTPLGYRWRQVHKFQVSSSRNSGK